jgi:hypothetical protein
MEAYYNNIAYLAQLYTLFKTHYEHLAAGKIEPEETQQVKEALTALTPLQTNFLQALNQITAPQKLLVYFPASAGSAKSRTRGKIPSADNALEFTRRLQFFGITPEVYFVDPNFADPSPLDAVEIARYPPSFHIIGLMDYQFWPQYGHIFKEHPGPIAWIHIALGTLTPDDTIFNHIKGPAENVIDWLTPNRLHLTAGSKPFNMLQLLEYGHYNFQTNTYTNPIIEDLDKRELPDTALYLQMDATTIFEAFTDDPETLRLWTTHFLPGSEKTSLYLAAIQLLTLIANQPSENPHRVWMSCNTLADWIETGKQGGSFSYTVVIPRPAAAR